MNTQPNFVRKGENINYLKICFKQINSLLEDIASSDIVVINNDIEDVLKKCKEIITELSTTNDKEKIIEKIISFVESFESLILEGNIDDDCLRMIFIICLEADKAMNDEKLHKLFVKTSILFNKNIRTNRIIVVRYRDQIKDLLGVFSDMDAVMNAIERKEALYSCKYKDQDFLIESSILNVMW